jgi:hypothetical protein
MRSSSLTGRENPPPPDRKVKCRHHSIATTSGTHSVREMLAFIRVLLSTILIIPKPASSSTLTESVPLAVVWLRHVCVWRWDGTAPPGSTTDHAAPCRFQQFQAPPNGLRTSQLRTTGAYSEGTRLQRPVEKRCKAGSASRSIERWWYETRALPLSRRAASGTPEFELGPRQPLHLRPWTNGPIQYPEGLGLRDASNPEGRHLDSFHLR